MTVAAPDYGNWIRLRVLAVFLAVGLAGLAVGLGAKPPLLRTLSLATAASFGAGLLALSYLRYQLSDRGAALQRALWDLVLRELPWDGTGHALDVGTGNGPLAIGLASRFRGARVTGIDRWGATWEYSREACLRNATLSGVAHRTDFRRASASDLPFADGRFDAVVSHFVFHEVSSRDGRRPLDEALRVLRKGGAFAFQDMFLDEKRYGRLEDLLAHVRSRGVAEVRFVDSRRQVALPPLLRHRRVLGCCGILCGRK